MTKILSLTIALILTGCSQYPLSKDLAEHNYTTNLAQEFKRSYQQWLNLKKRHLANYSYERDSYLAEGFHNSTKIVVENDQVEHRYFFEWQTGSTPSLTWHETYADLGRHNQGVSSKTLDELYQQCETQILNKSQSQFDITFKTDSLNILKQCSYTERQCSEKCTKGIKVSGLTLY